MTGESDYNRMIELRLSRIDGPDGVLAKHATMIDELRLWRRAVLAVFVVLVFIGGNFTREIVDAFWSAALKPPSAEARVLNIEP